MTDDGIMEPEYHMHSYLFNHSYSRAKISDGKLLLRLSVRPGETFRPGGTGGYVHMNKYVVWSSAYRNILSLVSLPVK